MPTRQPSEAQGYAAGVAAIIGTLRRMGIERIDYGWTQDLGSGRSVVHHPDPVVADYVHTGQRRITWFVEASWPDGTPVRGEHLGHAGGVGIVEAGAACIRALIDQPVGVKQ